MGVLHIVDRIVHIALLDSLKVKVHGRVRLAGQEHEPGGIDADFFDDAGQGLKGACPGRHAHRTAVHQQVDQLYQHHVKGILLLAHGGYGSAHAGNVAMVVCAPDVDEEVEAALVLVVMVGYVRGKIGEGAVALAQHPVLVVAKAACGEPQGAVLFIEVAGLVQGLEGLCNLAAVNKRFFREPVLVLYAEFLKIGLDAVQDDAHGIGVAAVLGLGVVHPGKGGILFQHLPGNVLDVLALVPVRGLFHGTVHNLAEAVPDRMAQKAHLASGVIDVVFGRDIEACLAQKAGQAVAGCCAAAVADMQRPCGVGGHVLHHGLAALAGVRRAVVLSLLFHVGNDSLPEGRGKGQVQEAWACNVGLCYLGAGLQHMPGQFLGNVPWRTAQGLCQHHGYVGCEIAVLRIL